MKRTVAGLLLGLVVPLAPLAAQHRAASPSEVLGIEVGADSVLADWGQIGSYMAQLAEASAYVRLDTIGHSTLGRPLLLVTLTAPRNQARLEAIREAQARLADPRGLTAALEDSLARHQPAVVFINNNIHSTEIASSQFSMILAHRLATEDRYRELLDRVIVLMAPSANPDGLDTVVAWYRKYRGTPYEGGPLPWLYQPYIGHDNNRDWFMFTQAETRAIGQVLYREWFPEVVWDVHQMGNRGARLFLPPFSDPVNPNIDPILLEATNLAGTAMASAIYDAGLTGVEHQSRFDLWWHGGMRTVPARHNMIGLLSEAASARLASPIFQTPEELRNSEAGVSFPQPWEGGWWRMGDIIQYELLAADGLLRLAGDQREQLVRRFVLLGRRAVARGEHEAPYAYVLPAGQSDPARVAVLANTILRAGVEMFRATHAFEAEGREYPAGSLVIPLAQPFRAHVKDLLERQDYPDRRAYDGGPPIPPYDVAGWTLGLQMGVEVRPVAARFSYESEPVSWATVEPGAVHGSGPQRVLTNRANMESKTIADALALGARVWVTARPVEAGGARLPAGSVVLEYPANPGRLDSLVAAHVRAYGYDAWAAAGLRPSGPVREGLPRIGLYKPWTASMDEGWTRWVFEQHGIPYQSVADADIRRGSLAERYDVLVLPDVGDSSIVSGHSPTEVPAEFAGGIGEQGARNVAEFVRGGGVLVTLDASSTFAISWLNLPVRNGLAASRGAPGGSRFYAPGSIFGVSLEPGLPLTSGYPDSAHVYFARSVVTDAAAPARVLGRYLPAPLRSGYALHQEQLAGKAALVDVSVGEGRAILFAFRPQHRGQTHGTFKLLFNAVLLSTLR